MTRFFAQALLGSFVFLPAPSAATAESFVFSGEFDAAQLETFVQRDVSSALLVVRHIDIEDQKTFAATGEVGPQSFSMQLICSRTEPPGMSIIAGGGVWEELERIADEDYREANVELRLNLSGELTSASALLHASKTNGVVIAELTREHIKALASSFDERGSVMAFAKSKSEDGDKVVANIQTLGAVPSATRSAVTEFARYCEAD